MALSLKDALDLYEKVETRANAYWTYWPIVVLGIAGWVFSNSHAVRPAHVPLVMLGAGVFFIANLAVVTHATRLAQVLWMHADTLAQSADPPSPLTRALAGGMRGRLPLTVALHLTVDALALLLLARQA